MRPEQLSVASVEQRFDAMVATYKPWYSLSVPVKVEIKSPAKISLSGRAYMVKDSVIHVSMRVLGFEVAVMRATPDSVYCVDKVHKLAVIESIDRLSANTGITLGQLQSLMLGRAVIPGENSKLSRKSRGVSLMASNDGTAGWSMTAVSKGKYPFTCVYEIGDVNNQVSSIQVDIPGNRSVKCNYNISTACELGFMPQSLSSDLTLSSKHLNATLRYTISSLKVDNIDLPSFRRPGSGYRIIAASDLLKSLSSSLL